MFRPIESHTFDRKYSDGDEIHVGRDRRGMYMVVFDGPDGLETVIKFDTVEIGNNTVEFFKTTPKRTVSTGQLEGTIETYGSVGEYLKKFEDKP